MINECIKCHKINVITCLIMLLFSSYVLWIADKDDLFTLVIYFILFFYSFFQIIKSLVIIKRKRKNV